MAAPLVKVNVNKHDVKQLAENLAKKYKQLDEPFLPEFYDIYEEKCNIHKSSTDFKKFIEDISIIKLDYEVIGLSPTKSSGRSKILSNLYHMDHFVMNIFSKEDKNKHIYISHQYKYTNIIDLKFDVTNPRNHYKQEWPVQGIIMKGSFMSSFKDIIDTCIYHYIANDYYKNLNTYPENCNGICGTILWNHCKYYKGVDLTEKFFHTEDMYQILIGKKTPESIICDPRGPRPRGSRGSRGPRPRGSRSMSPAPRSMSPAPRAADAQFKSKSKSKKSKSKKSKSKKSKSKKSKSKKSKSKKSKSKKIKV
jgi:hypothetical protein